MKVVIVIPAYKPDRSLVVLADDLRRKGHEMIIVDDGSGEAYHSIFASLVDGGNVRLLRHAVNLGKGQALKTAFNAFLLEYHPTDYAGVVTADADGQHRPDDIDKVVRCFADHCGDLVLGVRSLSSGNVPLRSRFGNSISRFVYRGLIGTGVSDTQTGLRAVPADFLPQLLQLTANGYEFELEMLVLASKSSRRITEVPIETVYIANNASSHFNPIVDSLRIYFVFFRFAALSLSTAFLDFVVFYLYFVASADILASTAVARLVAGTYNFTLSKGWVFRSGSRLWGEVAKYGVLVVALAAIAYGFMTNLILIFGMGVFTAKVLAEGILFLFSFCVQRLVVFGTDRDGALRETVDGRTDWDAYYRNPIMTSRVTRRITTRKIIRLIKQFASDSEASHTAHFCELGGANSCFFGAIKQQFPDAAYSIVDTNETGLALFRCNYPEAVNVQLLKHDVLTMGDPVVAADVVFSVGLIEHFTPSDTARAIRAHFVNSVRGTIVIITFPTPTVLYRFTRSMAEMMGIWRFPDERPLLLRHVIGEMSKYGEVVHSSINWSIILTQGIVAARVTCNASDIRRIPLGTV